MVGEEIRCGIRLIDLQEDKEEYFFLEGEEA
jgi:hypothetical protein